MAWNYCQTEYRIAQIDGGWGIIADGRLRFSAYDRAACITEARRNFGLWRDPLI